MITTMIASALSGAGLIMMSPRTSSVIVRVLSVAPMAVILQQGFLVPQRPNDELVEIVNTIH